MLKIKPEKENKSNKIHLENGLGQSRYIMEEDTEMAKTTWKYVHYYPLGKCELKSQ